MSIEFNNVIPPNEDTSRRDFLRRSGLGFGSIALADILQSENLLAAPSAVSHDLSPKLGHFAPRAKAVIQLFQMGGPSQMDLFDPKPELQRRDGQKHVEDVESFQPGSETNMLMGTPFKFARHGQCGMDFSEMLPHLASVSDHLCMIRSMHTGNNNHPQATRMINTGKIFGGRPTLGAWVSYGLGTENHNLPAYAVLRDPDGYSGGGTTQWENGWLPALYRGTEFRSRGEPVLNLHPAESTSADARKNVLDLIAKLNEKHRQPYPGQTDLEARIRNYELAARMQLHAENLLDISGETAATRKMYGLDNPLTADYGTRCLMARRMVEAGVRYVQLMPPIKPQVMPWDQHRNLQEEIHVIAPRVDQPGAALIRDLFQRGLLDEVIVMWTGEFGRLPISQLKNGRDHNRYAFTTLVAGGGFKAGHIHGATDEIGYKAAEGRVGVNDFLATIMHQVGLNHNRLTYKHNGIEETLTDKKVTDARVVGEVLKSPPEIS